MTPMHDDIVTENAKYLLRGLSPLLGLKKQRLTDPDMPERVLSAVRTLLKKEQDTTPTIANPDSYRSIALANGAKECNVYRHDDRIVIVVEMALNRKLAEVHDAIFIRTPAAKCERIELREVRAHHDSIDVDASATPSGALPDKPTDHLAELERRIAELERSVRNNTRRLDLAAAACALPVERWDSPEWCMVNAFAEHLGAGLKEQA